MPADLVACGEVGLGGEIRQVGQLERRLAEAARLGFRRALVPPSAPAAPPGIEVDPGAHRRSRPSSGPAWASAAPVPSPQQVAAGPRPRSRWQVVA